MIGFFGEARGIQFLRVILDYTKDIDICGGKLGYVEGLRCRPLIQVRRCANITASLSPNPRQVGYRFHMVILRPLRFINICVLKHECPSIHISMHRFISTEFNDPQVFTGNLYPTCLRLGVMEALIIARLRIQIKG